MDIVRSCKEDRSIALPGNEEPLLIWSATLHIAPHSTRICSTLATVLELLGFHRASTLSLPQTQVIDPTEETSGPHNYLSWAEQGHDEAERWVQMLKITLPS